MNFPRVLCALFLFCGLTVRGFGLDREAFTFTNYDLDVRIEPEQQRLAARGKVTLRNDSSSPQKNLSLQISSSLGWRSIQLEGKPVQFVSQPYTSDIDHTGALAEAIVSLPREVPPKGSVELEVGYEGTIPLDSTRLTRVGMPEEKARHMDWDQISKSATAVRGAGYVAWYPVAMESANLSERNSLFETLRKWKKREAAASVKITISLPTPSGDEAVSPIFCNGKSLHMPARGGNPRFPATECTFAPLGLDVPVFATNRYEVLDHPTISVLYLSGHKAGADNYVLAADLALPLVTEWFGAPREKAQVVDLADPEAAPFQSGTMLLTPLQTSDTRMYQLGAVYQLTNAAFPSPRPWIYEGLAHFAQALYREQHSGRKAALEFMDLRRPALAEVEETLAGRAATNSKADESLLYTSIEDFYRSKAMYVWWMLRDMVGEEPLKKAFMAYRPEQDKETSYMQRLIETQANKDLQWFFEDWVYHDSGLPDFRVESAYSRAATNGTQLVTVSIENLGNAGAEVPVTLRMKEGSVTRRLEVRARSSAVIRMEAISTPEEIVVNDGSVPERDLSNNAYKIEPLTH